MATQPLHQFQYGHVRASIWANPATHGAVYHTTFQRMYKDEEGEWQPANGFRTLDLPVLAFTSNEAHKWLSQREEREEAERKNARRKPVKTKAVQDPAKPEGNGRG